MSIQENLGQIRQRIESACVRSGRDPKDVRILGACKEQPVEIIREAVSCGVNILGENRNQEAELHMPALADLDIEWHFIGKLQKNKINKVLRSFHMIQSVDGVKTMEHIHKRVSEVREVFIEINIGDEKSKGGFTEDGLLKALNYISMLNRVRIVGLMSIPPFGIQPEDSRPYFRRLRELKNELNSRDIPNVRVSQLSMGMSDDYEVAVEEGATMVRIGSALFGRRQR